MNRLYTLSHALFSFISLMLLSCGSQHESTYSEKFPTDDKVSSTADASVQETQLAEYIVAMSEDSKGNLWFGTMAKGAICFDGKTIRYFTTNEGLCENTVASIVEDRDGNMWFGTHSGASRYDGKIFTHYSTANGLHGAGCQFLVDQKGNLWAGTNHGAFKFVETDDKQGYFEGFQLPKPTNVDNSYKWEAGKIWSLFEDTKGNLWFARDGYGACKYDGKEFTHFTKNEGLCSNNVSNIMEDDEGNIWFASLSSDFPEYIKAGGLSCYKGKSIQQFPNQVGLYNNDIYTLFKDKWGNCWIGAVGVGIYCFNGETFSLIKETDRMDLTYTMGLQSMLEDKHGTLWMGFSGGLFRLDGNRIVNVTKEELIRYTKRSGWSADDC